MNVIVCDDNAQDRAVLRQYLQRYAISHNLYIHTQEYSCAADLLAQNARSSEFASLVFLDIYMERMDGMQAARLLLENGYTGSIAFTTSSKEHALESYDVNAEGYLVKPFSHEALCAVLARCQRRWAGSQNTITFTSSHLPITVRLQDIRYIETRQHGCLVHTTGAALPTRQAIGLFEAELRNDPAFLRLGKSYLVNLNALSGFDEEKVTLGTISLFLPVRGRAGYRRKIAEFFWRQVRGHDAE